LTDKIDKSEQCIKLAQHFHDQYKAVMDIQWRYNLTSWGVFVGGAAVAINATAWHPAGWILLGSLILGGLYLGGLTWWLGHLNGVYEHLVERMEHWCSQAEACLVDPAVSPKAYSGKDSLMGQSNSSEATKPCSEDLHTIKYRWRFSKWQPSVSSQWWATMFFISLFLVVMLHKTWPKTFGGGEAKQGEVAITAKAGNFEINGLKLTGE
jgi:hypothetical protein